MALAVIAGAACGDGEDGRSSQSKAPEVTADPAVQDTLGVHTLRAADVRAIPGLADAVDRPPERAPAFENRDPRGPCGARTPKPPGTDHAALVTLRAGSYQIVEVVSAPPPASWRRTWRSWPPTCDPGVRRSSPPPTRG